MVSIYDATGALLASDVFGASVVVPSAGTYRVAVTGFDPLQDQEQQILPAIDVDFGPQWEFNFGVGVGTTRSTDHLIVKCIVGRRFSWPHGPGAKLKTPHD